ncbi:MAG: hypothetical protein ACM34F_00410 [Betaproteobacteria bacterium]
MRSRIVRYSILLASVVVVTAANAQRPPPRVGDAVYAATFVAQTVPAFIELFAPTSVAITMRNSGTVAWSRAEGDVFLATQEPQDNYFWCIQDNPHGMYSGNRVLLPHDVAPGEDVTFAFIVKPLACGFAATSPFRFRMLSQTYGTFGEETPDPGTQLSTAAEFVSQQAPRRAPTGARIPVSVVFRNTTLTMWHQGEGYALVPAGTSDFGVSSVALAQDTAPGALAAFAFDVTMPPTAATYDFQWRMTLGAKAFGQLSPATPIEVVAVSVPNFQGLWWAAPAGSEAGWGLNVAHQDDTIFATWFTYDAAGDPLWLSVIADRTLAGTYTGPLVQSTGPAFDVPVFTPNRVRSRTIGTATLAFAADGSGTFTYAIGSVTRTKTIVREVFGPLPVCTFDLESDLTLAYNYQDLWWAAPAGSQAGWGMNLTHQGDTIFGTWFTYDRDGSPLWLAFTTPKTDASAYRGTLYRTTGPSFDTVPFLPARVTATPVGTASVTFTSGNAATFAWSIEGVTRSTPITRQIFAAPGTICQ